MFSLQICWSLQLNCNCIQVVIYLFILYAVYRIHHVFFPAQKVTHWNTKKLQEAINNGGEIHPGATHVKVNNHMYKLSVDPPKRRAVAKQLPASRGSISHPGKDPKREFESKVVYRHIQDGDIVLVNRQV
jgi:DNA-directed RNA polymerase beta' subunit